MQAPGQVGHHHDGAAQDTDEQQLAAGVRFVQMAREGAYDVVVGNPPYQGTSKMAEADWFKKQYPRSKADLYACFLERGLEFAKAGGVSALLTMRGWMFLSSYQALREGLLKAFDLAAMADLGSGAFEDINAAQVVVSVSLTTLWKREDVTRQAVAVRPTPPEDKASTGMTARKRAGLMVQVGRYEFDVGKLAGIEGTPLVYWWDEAFLDEYIKAPKLGDVAPGRAAQSTGDNTRFTRYPWEVNPAVHVLVPQRPSFRGRRWYPFVNGSGGYCWIEPLRSLIHWESRGLELKQLKSYLTGRDAFVLASEEFFLGTGASFSMIGSEFSARAHRFSSVLGDKGSAVYPERVGESVCQMNQYRCRETLQSLNPTVSFQVGDVNRLPLFTVPLGENIFHRLTSAFTLHESHREASVEFKSPGPSPWRYAQDWAQRAVDRAKGEPLPPYEPEFDPPDPTSFVSFAIGVALGRFGQNGGGILDLSLPSAPGSTPQAERRESAAPSAGAKTKNGREGGGETEGQATVALGGHSPAVLSASLAWR